jgi:SAM-dependent methyltransferase
MIEIFEMATAETFDAEGYLWANPDLQEAFGEDLLEVAHHFEIFGHSESRRQLRRAALPQIVDSRERKLEGLALGLDRYTMDILGQPMSMEMSPDARLPVPYERVSDHEYDAEIAAIVDADPKAVFIDVGAGLRHTYRDNVIYAEIAPLLTTDVLCFADDLPFASETFDGGLCLAVLEHVPDPWSAARELMRVLKKGARVVVDWPFLQPVHGYPHHYFNATALGASETFERLGAEVRSYVPPSLHPVFTLHWFLQEWDRGLPPAERQNFSRLTVGEVLGDEPVALLESRWSRLLTAEAQSQIAAGTRLLVTKR